MHLVPFDRRPLDLDKGQPDGGLPLRWLLQDQAVERIPDLPARHRRGGADARVQLSICGIRGARARALVRVGEMVCLCVVLRIVSQFLWLGWVSKEEGEVFKHVIPSVFADRGSNLLGHRLLVLVSRLLCLQAIPVITCRRRGE